MSNVMNGGFHFLNDSTVGGGSLSQSAALGGLMIDIPGPMGTEVNLTHPISIDLGIARFLR